MRASGISASEEVLSFMKNQSYYIFLSLCLFPLLSYPQNGDIQTFYRYVDLADFFEKSGNIEKSIEYREKMLEVSRGIPNDTFPLLYSLFGLAVVYDTQNTQDCEIKAARYYEELLQILDPNTQATDFLLSLESASIIYHKHNKYNECISLIHKYENLLPLIDTILYKKEILDILYWKASAYQHLNFSIKGSREEAVSIQKSRILHWGELYGCKSIEYLEELYYLIHYLPYDEKEVKKRIYEYAFSILKEMPDRYSLIAYPAYVNNYLTFLYKEGLDTDRIKEVEDEMEKICSLSTTHYNTKINYYLTQSKIATNRLEYEKADSLCDKALSVCEDNMDKTVLQERYAQILAQKSKIKYSTGGVEQADLLVNMAYHIIVRLNNENEVFAEVLSNLSHVKANLGDFKESERLMDLSLSVQEKCNPRHVDPFALIHLLSLKKGQDVIVTFHKYIDNNEYLRLHPVFGCILPHIGNAYTSLGECHKADSIFDEAEALLETNKNHPIYTERDSARYFDALASLYMFRGGNSFKQGQFDECLSLFERSYSYSKEPYALSVLSLLYAITNDTTKFEESLKLMLDFETSQIKEKFRFLSEHEREVYMKNQQDLSLSFIEMAPSLIGKSEIVQCAYDATLLHKSMLLSSYTETKRQLSNDENLIALKVTEVKSLKNAYSIAENIEERNDLNDRIKTLEKQIQKYVSHNSTYIDDLIITWKDVKNSLEESEAVIEFVQHSSIEDFLWGGDSAKSTKYGALVLTPNDSIPQFVSLCSNEDLVETRELYSQNNLEQIAKIIWEPLISIIQGYKTIYFSPIGDLHSMNLEVLANSLLERQFIRVSSSRVLCQQRNHNAIKNAMLYGGLDYNSETSINQPLTTTNAISYLRHTNHIGSTIYPLQSTRKEVETIHRLMSEKKIESVLYLGKDGTEESYKRLNNQEISVLHIATHGFSTSVSAITDYDEPMRKCGLLLAKAQNAWEKKDIPKGIEDGILLGEEIVNVNLKNNDLVTLSACGTGLGDISPEGVWGLLRAFKKAGAKSILMSLWNVDDFTTQLLMTEFYKHYLSGINKQESLKRAQQYVREYEDEEGNRLFEDPSYWAGFILLDALD